MVLETAVVMWTAQIKSVLKTDPESVLYQSGSDVEHPGPLKGTGKIGAGPCALGRCRRAAEQLVRG